MHTLRKEKVKPPSTVRAFAARARAHSRAVVHRLASRQDPAERVARAAFSDRADHRSETAVDFADSATAPYLTVEIFDMSGRLIHGNIIDHCDEQSRRSLEVNLARGIYLLRLSDGEHAESTRFFY